MIFYRKNPKKRLMPGTINIGKATRKSKCKHIHQLLYILVKKKFKFKTQKNAVDRGVHKLNIVGKGKGGNL